MKKEIEILIKSGQAGAGAVSFRKEKFIPKGGPDGGDGGDGGDVLFESNENILDLSEYFNNQKIIAGRGEDGQKSNKNGRKGKDIVIKIPPDCEITTDKGEVIFLKDKDKVIFLKGGLRGRGNKSFKTSTNQEPLLAEYGEPGLERKITISMKSLPKVGIIGTFNSGKSFLLNKLTNSNFKEAEYPYSTRDINTGMILTDIHTVKIIEIPDFLTSEKLIKYKDYLDNLEVIIISIDVNDNPIEKINIINNIIQKEVIHNPEIVIFLNKTNLIDGNKIEDIKKRIKKISSSIIQYFYEDNIKESKKIIIELFNNIEVKKDKSTSNKEVIHSPKIINNKKRFFYDKNKSTVFVQDKKIIQVAKGSDLNRPETQLQFHNFLRRTGYIARFEESKIPKGTRIKFDDIDMEFI